MCVWLFVTMCQSCENACPKHAPKQTTEVSDNSMLMHYVLQFQTCGNNPRQYKIKTFNTRHASASTKICTGGLVDQKLFKLTTTAANLDSKLLSILEKADGAKKYGKMCRVFFRESMVISLQTVMHF